LFLTSAFLNREREIKRSHHLRHFLFGVFFAAFFLAAFLILMAAFLILMAAGNFGGVSIQHDWNLCVCVI
jgi:hypothetical protein